MSIRALLSITLLLIVFLINSTPSAAQDIAFKKKNFKGQEKEFSEAKKSLKKGLKYFDTDEPDYRMALEHFNKAQEFNTSNAELNRMIGTCYLELLEAGKAVYHLDRALQLDGKQKSPFWFDLARAYHLNSQFDLAIGKYNDYLNHLKKKKMKAETDKISRLVMEATLGMELVNQANTGLIVEYIPGQINSAQADFHAQVSNLDSFWCFTSSRFDSGERKKRARGVETVYFVRKGLNGNLEVNRAGGKINEKKVHVMAVYLSPDGQQLILRKGDQPGDLQSLRFSRNGKWKKDKGFGRQILKHGPVNSIAVSSDQQWLVFTAEGKAKKGGSELYIASMGKKRWERPVKADFNTAFDERGCSFSPDGQRLYFASLGLPGIGGYDLFYCQREGNGWSKPVNAGIPINSPFDEISLTFDPASQTGVLCSNRQGGAGSFDLYFVRDWSTNSAAPVPYEIVEPGYEQVIVSEVVVESDDLDGIEEIYTEEAIPPAGISGEPAMEYRYEFWYCRGAETQVTKAVVADMNQSILFDLAPDSSSVAIIFNKDQVSDLIWLPYGNTSLDLGSTGIAFSANSAGNGIWLKPFEFLPGSTDLTGDPQATLQLLKAFSDEFPEARYQLLVTMPADSLQPGLQGIADARAQKLAELLYMTGVSPDRLSHRGQVSINNEGLVRPAERVELIIVDRF
jgi:hypothetical protein